MSELVKRLVGKCGPTDTSLMCDYLYNMTNISDEKNYTLSISIGPGVYESLW